VIRVTATFFLVRHAAHALVDRVLVGRSANVALSDQGREQSKQLAARLARERIDEIHSSPRQRAIETAEAIAKPLKIQSEVVEAVDEIDVGEWTGRSFAELEQDPSWREWCAFRSRSRAPRGESMVEAQQRVVAHLDRVGTDGPENRIVVVSHADVIRSAILHYLGLSLDAYDRIVVDPATISTLVVGNWGAKLLSLNEPVTS
jgi:broad specificity phosphatase PhoE